MGVVAYGIWWSWAVGSHYIKPRFVPDLDHHLRDRLRDDPVVIRQMNNRESFIDFALCKDIIKAHKAGVFGDMGVEGDEEDRYVSELKRRMKAFDEKSVFVALRAFVKYHRKTVINTLEYIEKEGESNG